MGKNYFEVEDRGWKRIRSRPDSYFLNTTYDCVVRVNRNGSSPSWHVKFKNGEEGELVLGSDLSVTTTSEMNFITKEEYDSY